jgi:hypothetical protein
MSYDHTTIAAMRNALSAHALVRARCSGSMIKDYARQLAARDLNDRGVRRLDTNGSPRRLTSADLRATAIADAIFTVQS